MILRRLKKDVLTVLARGGVLVSRLSAAFLLVGENFRSDDRSLQPSDKACWRD
jgi:hypothetical protein